MKIVIVMLAMLLMAVPAIAKEGFYVGAGLGADHYSALGPLYMVPAGNIKLGYDFGGFALEINLITDKHDDKLFNYGAPLYKSGFELTSTLVGKSLDFHIPFIRVDQQKNYYGIIGAGEYALSGNNNTIGSSNQLVTYSGIGINLGIGRESYLSEHLAFDMAAIYHTIRYDKKEDVATTTALSPKLNGDFLSVIFGLSYHF